MFLNPIEIPMVHASVTTGRTYLNKITKLIRKVLMYTNNELQTTRNENLLIFLNQRNHP